MQRNRLLGEGLLERPPRPRGAHQLGLSDATARRDSLGARTVVLQHSFVPWKCQPSAWLLAALRLRHAHLTIGASVAAPSVAPCSPFTRAA
eukprot:5188526-Pleurochrysis_carterae.AAC.2